MLILISPFVRSAPVPGATKTPGTDDTITAIIDNADDNNHRRRLNLFYAVSSRSTEKQNNDNYSKTKSTSLQTLPDKDVLSLEMKLA